MAQPDPKDIHIINTAAKHFAINGYGSARMDEIALDANVNKATIYYRIGDKEALYERVYTTLLDDLLSEIRTQCSKSNNAVDALRAYIKTIAIVCDKNTHMSRIVLREVASQGQHLSETTLKQMQNVRMYLKDILETGMVTGEFRKHNPFMIHMLIVGFLNFYAASKPIRVKISNISGNSTDTIAVDLNQAAEEITELVLNSIAGNS